MNGESGHRVSQSATRRVMRYVRAIRRLPAARRAFPRPSRCRQGRQGSGKVLARHRKEDGLPHLSGERAALARSRYEGPRALIEKRRRIDRAGTGRNGEARRNAGVLPFGRRRNVDFHVGLPLRLTNNGTGLAAKGANGGTTGSLRETRAKRLGVRRGSAAFLRGGADSPARGNPLPLGATG